MTSAQVVETSVTNNSFSDSYHNYPNPNDDTVRTTDTPGFKPVTTMHEWGLLDCDRWPIPQSQKKKR